MRVTPQLLLDVSHRDILTQKTNIDLFVSSVACLENAVGALGKGDTRRVCGNRVVKERGVQLDRFASLPASPGYVDEIGILGEERSVRIHVMTIPCLRESIDNFSHTFLVGRWLFGLVCYNLFSFPDSILILRLCLPEHISTSYVERSKPTLRMQNRRFTRLTNAFSTKIANHKNMPAITWVFYNFARIHQTLKITPAMEGGISDRVWALKKSRL